MVNGNDSDFDTLGVAKLLFEIKQDRRGLLPGALHSRAVDPDPATATVGFQERHQVPRVPSAAPRPTQGARHGVGRHSAGAGFCSTAAHSVRRGGWQRLHQVSQHRTRNSCEDCSDTGGKLDISASSQGDCGRVRGGCGAGSAALETGGLIGGSS